MRRAAQGAAALPVPFWMWALLGVTGFCLGWHWIKNEDLGFQLHAARYILAVGDVPRAEPFLWTEPGGTYTDLQWLWQLGIHACWKLSGYGGLMAANLAVQFLAFLVWGWRTWRLSSGVFGIGTFSLLLLFFYVNNWPIRPHNLSWVYLGLTLLLLEERGRGNRRALWFLPLVFLAWVNCHALFSLGLLAVGLWILGEAGSRYLRLGRSAAWEGTLPFLGPLAAAAVACWLNPYGWQGLLFPLHQSKIVTGTHAAKDLILEFLPLWRALWPEAGLVFPVEWLDSAAMAFLMVALLLGLFWGRSQAPAPAWLPIAVFLLLAFQMVKNFNYFFMMAGPYAAVGWDSWLARGRPKMAAGLRRGALGICLFFCAVLPTGLWSNWVWGLPFGPGLDKKVHPTELARVLQSCPDTVRLLNGPDIGGWLGWISGQKVFMDGRNDNYSEELLLSYFQAVESPSDFVALLDRWQINAVVARYESEPRWIRTLLGITGRSRGYFRDSRGQPVPLWRCVARDEYTALFFRYDLCPGLPARLEPEPGHDCLQGREGRLDEILQTQARKPEAGWRNLYLGPEAFPVRLNLLVARSVDFGEYAEGKGYAVAGMEGCDWFYPNLWSNLAYLFEMEGDVRRADFCWKTIAEKTSDPRWREKEAAARRRRAEQSRGP